MDKDNVKKVYLLPGESYISKEPTLISTLLGSCVSVGLFNRVHKFGGMNHYMLPNLREDDIPCGKYGDYSIEKLIEKMLFHDSNMKNINALVLGGGKVVGHLNIGEGVGAGNIVTARDILDKYNIPIIYKDIGGINGRKLKFQNWTGEIRTKKIERSEQGRAIDAKKEKILKNKKIKVLVVDDSRTVRNIIIKAISTDNEVEVVGAAENPYEAREMILEHDPDVICLDIIMPKMDGITFLKKIFLYMPKPVIIVSTVAQQGSKLRKQADAIGAVDVIDKEELNLYKGIETIKNILIGKIKMAAVTVVKKKSKEELDNI